MVAGALVAYGGLHAQRGVPLVVAAGSVGWLALAGALMTGAQPLVPVGLLLLGGEYALSLLVRGGRLDGLAPVVGATLFVVAELSYFALEREARTYERALATRRMATVAIAGLVAGAVGAIVVTAAEFAVRGGVLLEAIGVVGAICVAGAAAVLAWRNKDAQLG